MKFSTVAVAALATAVASVSANFTVSNHIFLMELTLTVPNVRFMNLGDKPLGPLVKLVSLHGLLPLILPNLNVKFTC